MKHIIFVTIIISVTSCNSGQKLFQRTTTSDNGKITVKKGFFSGIHYINFEKRIPGKVKYYMFYDCECDDLNKLALRKGVMLDDGNRTLWNAVTDTTGGQSFFFNEMIAKDRLNIPIEFMAITEEEISLLEEGISKVDKVCCKHPDKPIKKIIGYVRVKLIR